MIDADGFLGTVRSLAPSRGALARLDYDFTGATGRAPKTLTRAVLRAERRGRVSEKVASAVADYLAPKADRVLFRNRCPRCWCYLRSANAGPYCSPCEGAFR